MHRTILASIDFSLKEIKIICDWKFIGMFSIWKEDRWFRHEIVIAISFFLFRKSFSIRFPINQSNFNAGRDFSLENCRCLHWIFLQWTCFYSNILINKSDYLSTLSKYVQMIIWYIYNIISIDRLRSSTIKTLLCRKRFKSNPNLISLWRIYSLLI